MSIYIVECWPSQDYYKLIYSPFYLHQEHLRNLKHYDSSIGNHASYYILQISVFTTWKCYPFTNISPSPVYAFLISPPGVLDCLVSACKGDDAAFVFLCLGYLLDKGPPRFIHSLESVAFLEGWDSLLYHIHFTHSH